MQNILVSYRVENYQQRNSFKNEQHCGKKQPSPIEKLLFSKHPRTSSPKPSTPLARTPSQNVPCNF